MRSRQTLITRLFGVAVVAAKGGGIEFAWLYVRQETRSTSMVRAPPFFCTEFLQAADLGIVLPWS